MALWRFRCYVSTGGLDEIRAAYDARRHAQAKFRARLATLAQLRWEEWREPLFKRLQRDCEGLWEVRFKARNNVQQRPLGFRSGSDEFTPVILGRGKERSMGPAECLRTGPEA